MRWLIKHSSAILFVVRFIVWPLFLAPAVKMAFQNHPFEYWGLWLMVGVTFSIIATYYLLKLGDYFEEMGEGAEEGNRVANVLMGLRLAGNQITFAKEVVNIWYDNQPDNAVLRLATKEGLYAKLREAVRRGWIKCPNFPAHEVRRDFQLDLVDCIEFFRNRRWLQIGPEKLGDG